jgi:hypothetical protein
MNCDVILEKTIEVCSIKNDVTALAETFRAISRGDGCILKPKLITSYSVKNDNARRQNLFCSGLHRKSFHFHIFVVRCATMGLGK